LGDLRVIEAELVRQKPQRPADAEPAAFQTFIAGASPHGKTSPAPGAGLFAGTVTLTVKRVNGAAMRPGSATHDDSPSHRGGSRPMGTYERVGNMPHACLI